MTLKSITSKDQQMTGQMCCCERPDYDTGKKDNDHVTMLPSTLFIKSLTEAEPMPTAQDKSKLLPWIDPHELKKAW
jgi:hypothetical protein